MRKEYNWFIGLDKIFVTQIFATMGKHGNKGLMCTTAPQSRQEKYKLGSWGWWTGLKCLSPFPSSFLFPIHFPDPSNKVKVKE